MFNSEKIEALEKEVRYDYEILVGKINKLYLIQRKIMDFIGAESKTTEAKTELVKKEK